jgi:hypothetical protein
VALILLQLAVWYVGVSGDVSSLRTFQWMALRTVGLYGLIALSYTVWPRRTPGARAQRSPPGTQSTSPTSLLAVRARMKSRSDSRLR